jgi:ABC-2 type transport system permease protein
MLRHELTKLLTVRSTLVGATTVVVGSALLALLTAQALGTADEGYRAASMAQLVLRTSSPALVMAAVLGVASVRGEVRDGVLRSTVLARRSRGAVLAAKAGAVLVVSAVVAAASALASVAAVVASAGPLPAGTWTAAVVAHSLVAGAWAVTGLCAGVLVPHVAGATAVALGLPLVVEPAVATLAAGSRVAEALPFRSVLSAYELLGSDAAGAPVLADSATALPFVAAAAVAGSVAWRRFARMDL